MGRRLSEWERLDRARDVAARDLAVAESEVEKLGRQLERLDAGEFKTVDREHFSRKHSSAQVKVLRARERFEEAQSAQAAYESTRARFAPPPPEPEGPILEGEELTSTIAALKAQAEEIGDRRRKQRWSA